MKNRNLNFLILVEGQKDVKNFARLFESYFVNILDEKSKNFDESELRNLQIEINRSSHKNFELEVNSSEILNFTVPNSKSENAEIKIFIKTAHKNTLNSFVEKLSEDFQESFERLYNSEKDFTFVYSFFDFDPGSNTGEILKNYFLTKDNFDNFYPIINYPAFESWYFHGNHKNIFINKDKIKLSETFSHLIFDEKSIKMKNESKISLKLKDYKNNVGLTEYINCENILPNSKSYLEENILPADEIDFLYEQEKIFNEHIFDEQNVLVVSFAFSVLDNIADFILNKE